MSSVVQCQNYIFFYFLWVCWVEVDLQGIVFNGNYLIYFDVVIIEYYCQFGMFYLVDLLCGGGDLFVVKSILEYCVLVYFDDWLDIGICVVWLGCSSLVFELGIWCDEQLFIVGELVYVYVDVNE